MAGRSWSARVVGGIGALLLLCACSNDPNALYARMPKGASGADAGARPALPILPAQPDAANAAACEACAKDKCAMAHDNCREDDDCAEMLACKGKCSEPGCLATCDAALADSAWYDDLAVCVFDDRCGAPCHTGENFACAGNYDLPVAEQARFPVRIRFRNGGGVGRSEPFVAGAEVRTCRAPDSPCTDTNLIDRGRMDSSNTVRLEWWSTGPTFIEIEDERIAPYGWRERCLWPPPTQSMDVLLEFAGPEILQGNAPDSLGQQARAPLGIRIGDCLVSPARNVRVVLPDLPEVEVQHFDSSFMSAEATTIGRALVTDVPDVARADRIDVQVIEVGSQRVVAEGEAFVRAGWNTHLALIPRAR